MTGILIFSIVGSVVIATGLYNLGVKAREMDRTDDDFFQLQLQLAKKECYQISEQFAQELASERRSYIHRSTITGKGYEEWMTKGVETFFNTVVSPKLVDIHRECLIQYSAYPEIIDRVAVSTQKES
jgi:Na+-transporting NADH:ubiquinone oxidoreductase subunit NqrC